MPIELKTGRYKMRNGKIAVITKLDPHCPLRLVAEGYFEGECGGRSWYPGGNYFDDENEDEFDLIEYVGALEPEIKRIDDVLPDFKAERKAIADAPRTLRDGIAIAAMQGMLANPNCGREFNTLECYKLADAMLEARKNAGN